MERVTITTEDGSVIEGRKDTNGDLQGRAVITAPDGSYMKASFRNGELDGLVEQHELDGSAIASHYKDGIMHGLQKSYEDGDLMSEISYEDGDVRGPCTLYLSDGGRLHSYLTTPLVPDDSLGCINGSRSAYVYPGSYLGLVGTFKAGAMICGHLCKDIEAVLPLLSSSDLSQQVSTHACGCFGFGKQSRVTVSRTSQTR